MQTRITPNADTFYSVIGASLGFKYVSDQVNTCSKSTLTAFEDFNHVKKILIKFFLLLFILGIVCAQVVSTAIIDSKISVALNNLLPFKNRPIS